MKPSWALLKPLRKVSVTHLAHERLKVLSARTGEPPQVVVDAALRMVSEEDVVRALDEDAQDRAMWERIRNARLR